MGEPRCNSPSSLPGIILSQLDSVLCRPAGPLLPPFPLALGDFFEGLANGAREKADS